MALLAESLVEEWLNRDNYFTIRGVKHGVREMDLLAVRHQQEGIVGWHVEVQASVHAIGYICGLTKEMVRGSGRKRGSIKRREPEEIEACVRQWVQDKFRAPTKTSLRQTLWPEVEWSFHLVHGDVRYPEELEVFKSEGVICHSFHDVLAGLCRRRDGSFSGSAGGDIADIISYYNRAVAPNTAHSGR